MKPCPNQLRCAQAGYTLAEVAVAVAALGVIIITLFAAFSSGLALVELCRENLRATQIMTQKTETVRLYQWGKIPTGPFTETYNPSATNGQSQGTVYRGNITTQVSPPGIPTAYRTNMVLFTVTLNWTNYPHGIGVNPIVRTRQMQTYVSRYGMQNYVFQ